MIQAGDFVRVEIIDTIEDGGDGSVIFAGWDEVQRINSRGNLKLYRCALIALPQEVLYALKIKTTQ